MSDLLQIYDTPLCNDDMWGLEFPCGLGPRENPPYYMHPAFRKKHAHAMFGVQLSTNPKTVICLSEWFNTCHKTPFCREFCYGLGVNFQSDHTRRVLEANVEAFKHISHDAGHVDALADLIVDTCRHYHLDNLRWHGVGDLNPWSDPVLVAIAERRPDFIVWGFSRREERMNVLPVLDNLIIWASVDPTMTNDRIHRLAQAADRHGTGLALTTEIGIRHPPRVRNRPREIMRALTSAQQPTEDELAERDYGFLERTYDALLSTSLRAFPAGEVSFGYHGPGITTHLGWTSECPATDPLGGGHFHGACQECRWCMRRHLGTGETLAQHRMMTQYKEGGKTYSMDRPELIR